MKRNTSMTTTLPCLKNESNFKILFIAVNKYCSKYLKLPLKTINITSILDFYRIESSIRHPVSGFKSGSTLFLQKTVD